MKYILKIVLLVTLILSNGTYAMADCIGIIVGSADHHWNELKKGAIQASTELGISLYIRGTVDGADKKGQKFIINAAIKYGCKGLVLAPNADEIKKIVTQLKAQGIPTVYVDRDVGGDRVSIISTNNFLAGELAGKEMVKALNGKGRIALFRLSKDISSTTEREKGFISAATKGGLEIVTEQYIGTRVGVARGNSLDTIERMNDIDGIFTPNESSTLGVLINIKKLNKTGEIIHIGFDSHEMIVDSLQSNHIYGSIFQNPFKMGYQSVHTLYKLMQEDEIQDKIQDKIDIKSIFVNKKNLNNSKVIDLLSQLK